MVGLVPARRGPKGASKLTPGLAARTSELDADGQTLRQIAATGCRHSPSGLRWGGSVRAAGGQGAAPGTAPTWVVHLASRTARRRPRKNGSPCCPIRCPRTGSGRWPSGGLFGVGADPVFAAGAGYPLAGLLLALPAVEATGLVEAAPADSPTRCRARTGCSRRSQPAHGRPTADAQQH